MDRLFVDTNIVLDLLMARKDFYQASSELFSLSDSKKMKLPISSLTFANTHYLIEPFE